MDERCLDHLLTEEERLAFDRDGYLIVRDAISASMVDAYLEVTDRVVAERRKEKGQGPGEVVNILDFISRDESYLDLIDCPTTFPKVWGILGWNIQLYHTHVIVSPPTPEGADRPLGWHQDTGRLNRELEGSPRPRVSLKVAYFLSDSTQPGRANLCVVPGSHLINDLDRPKSGRPDGALEVLVAPGDAVFFDRRIWHASSPNISETTRKVLFYGYSYRWLRPRDDMEVGRYVDACGPVRRQLLGCGTGGFGYTSPRDEDVPLRSWIRDHIGEEAVAP
jgi:ectoine hydroxylase-related dioxygenase (phytanoyl-CoA dioxygenase family)